MKPRNEEIFNQTKNLADTFIGFFDKYPFLESYGSLFDRVNALVHADSNLISKILELRQDIEQETISKCLLQSEKLARTLMDSDIITTLPHPFSEEGHKDQIAWFLTKVLEVWKNQKRFFSKEGIEKQYSTNLFPRLYERYESYLYDPAPRNYLVFPINNLFASKPLKTDVWQIRQLSEGEFDSLVDAHHKKGMPLETYPETVLCLDYNSDWQKNVSRAVSTLRLLKPEKIYLGYGYRAFHFPFHAWEILEAPEGTKIAKKTSFKASDVVNDEQEVANLWSVLRDLSDTSYLNKALRRFNFAYEREQTEDAWVDYFIALESLFLKESGENSELVHRLSIRISKALSENLLIKRKEMKKRVQDWYTVRSKVVHGAFLKPRELIQIDDLNKVVSESFKWYFRNADRGNHDAVLELLDLM